MVKYNLRNFILIQNIIKVDHRCSGNILITIYTTATVTIFSRLYSSSLGSIPGVEHHLFPTDFYRHTIPFEKQRCLPLKPPLNKQR
jgi:hypothetical protein